MQSRRRFISGVLKTFSSAGLSPKILISGSTRVYQQTQQCRTFFSYYSQPKPKTNSAPKEPELQAGQPIHQTHPHLIAKDEITKGNTKEEYVRRRERVFRQLPPHSLMVLSSFPVRWMTTDVPYFFRQETNFRFVTGLEDPDCIAVLEKDAQMNCIYRLFVPEKNPDTTLWHGLFTDSESAPTLFGCDEALPVTQFEQFLTKKLSVEVNNKKPVLFYRPGTHPLTDERVRGCAAAARLSELRDSIHLVQAAYRQKSPADIAMLHQAAEISNQMYRTVLQCTRAGMTEQHLEAILEFEARLRGASRLAYPPVVACGKNALALHYIKNTQILRDGEMVLVDAGAEYHGYTSDVSRTWPISGKFSHAQKLIYNAVLDVQREVINAHFGCRNQIPALYILSQQLLAERLIDMKLLKKAPLRELLMSGALQRLYPHSQGHPMGFDIHEQELDRKHIPGMVVTVEPGLYIPDDEDIPKEFRGICVRIEDNIVLTDGVPIVLTRNIPKTVEEIEQIMEQGRSEQKASPFVKHVMAHHRF